MFSVFIPATVCRALCEKTETLFIVERSKNGNTVHYDACTDGNDNLSASDPVIAYWVLENGKKEELGSFDKKLAYGVKLLEKANKDSARVSIAGIKKKEIIVEKIENHYRAVIMINGKESVLERVYIKSRDPKIGLPTVLFADFFGKTKAEGISVTQRIEKP